ncbi:MAG: ABC transporter ATP-binding protein [Bacteroidota bacterium]
MKHLITTVLTILNPKERVRMFKLIAADLVINILDIVFLALMLLLVNFYTKGATVSSAAIFNYLTHHNSLFLVTAFFLLFSLKNWLGYRISALQHHFFFGIASRLSKRNIEYYLNDRYTQFVNVDSSVQVRKISQQPIEFSTYVLVNMQQALSQSMLILFTIIAILFYHPNLFLLLFVLLLPPVVLLAYLIKKRLKSIRIGMKVMSEKTIQHLQESLAGFVESRLYGKHRFFADRYHSFQRQLNDNIATQKSIQGLPSRMVEVFAILGFLILLALNKFHTSSLRIDLLDIGVFLAAAYKIIPGIVKILNSTGQIKAYEFTLKDLLIEQQAQLGHSSAQLIEVIKFEEVSYDYQDRSVLKKCSFEINAGDFVGISGKSAAGKTTLINLLLGFLSPRSGAVFINNQKLSGLEMQHHWNRISYVKQQPFFINDTVLKNICLCDDGYDSDRLNKAVDFSGIANSLGLNQVVSEQGKNISGGQRQRIALARAIYHDFDLLLLDEPFSEMDETSEREILHKLVAIAKAGKIVLLITHHQKGLALCHKIITLNGQ